MRVFSLSFQTTKIANNSTSPDQLTLRQKRHLLTKNRTNTKKGPPVPRPLGRSPDGPVRDPPDTLGREGGVRLPDDGAGAGQRVGGGLLA